MQPPAFHQIRVLVVSGVPFSAQVFQFDLCSSKKINVMIEVFPSYLLLFSVSLSWRDSEKRVQPVEHECGGSLGADGRENVAVLTSHRLPSVKVESQVQSSAVN
ncbi:hypothetical protein PILCRDRAFT_194109 [Piloderma croceum F 1598]|uniref:Uncharacterized protein n=1 Tax=Piloderma croceum (strain F 1598) TaxID=765440 RepID=A0A0C3BT52_PILCF|nr:hypothetical protein PILCRDRAFT_194109 [Piloderma croceum F 1598]